MKFFPVSRVATFKRFSSVALGLLLPLTLATARPADAQEDGPDFYVVNDNLRGQISLSNLETVTRFGFSFIRVANTRRITGLQRNERILGIDFRPATGQLYGLGSSSRLYLIDKNTAAATQVGKRFVIPLTGTSFGFDFNPTVDRIRVTSDADQNLRLNPNNGAVVDFNPGTTNVEADGNLTYGDGSNPSIGGSAYINNDTDPNTGTVLYNIDTVRDTLVTQGTTNGTVSPNSGQLFTVGSLEADATYTVGFDIVTASGQNVAYAILRRSRQGASSPAVLSIVDLGTGRANLLGLILDTQNIVGFAIETS